MDPPNKNLILKYELKGHIPNYLFRQSWMHSHYTNSDLHETFLDVQVRVSCQSKTEFCGLWFSESKFGLFGQCRKC